MSDRKHSYAILGAGRQGVALAYSLAAHAGAARVILADVDETLARRAVARLQALVPGSSGVFESRIADVSDAIAVRLAIRGADVAISAVPYRYNVALTDVAIDCGVSFCDLGGNTGVVRQQLARHEAATRAKVSVVPDCGLAPGLGNILAAHGIAQFEEALAAHVRCGGLPQQPIGPLGYKLVFNFEGLINEYSGLGEFLREGKRLDVPTLTELEELQFDVPRNRAPGGASERLALEAAVTSGGTSTCPTSFAGRIRDYDYKTIRYPGHFAIIRALFGLGCFDESFQAADGETLQPRRMMRKIIEKQLDFPQMRDMVLLRASVRGRAAGRESTLQYDLVDFHDERTGFTSMERTTAFPTALVAAMQARGQIAAGARPLEICLPTAAYMAELGRFDIRVETRTLG